MDFQNHSLNKQKTGYYIEDRACKYLEARGLVLLKKNYRTRFGEIDLVMRDKNIVVFIEVRYRRSEKYGGALESIDRRKQNRITRSAQQYLLHFRLMDRCPCRFDVVIVSGSLSAPVIEWVPQAFE